MRKIKIGVESLCLASVLILACSFSNQHQTTVTVSPEKTKTAEIHVINVGQGDAFLIVAPSGKKVLIDAGNTGRGAGIVLPYLKEHGITSLDFILATHYHSDHIGGLDEVVDGIGGYSHITYAAFDRGGNYDSNAFRDYIKSINYKRKTISPGMTIDLGDDISMRCIASNGDILNGRIYSGIDENALSIVLIFKYRDFDMYFGGDSNSFVEPALAPYAGDVDVYKVSHHGSATSSTQQLLDYLKPEVSVIAVGNGNSYGHPNAGTVEKLVAMNSYIYQTESGTAVPPAGKGEVANGNFEIITDGDSYTISGSSLITVMRLTDEKGTRLMKKIFHVWPILFHLPIKVEATGGRAFWALASRF